MLPHTLKNENSFNRYKKKIKNVFLNNNNNWYTDQDYLDYEL